MTTSNISQNKRLEQWFEIELQYTQQFPDAATVKGRVGEYIGSGQGSVNGSRLRGQVSRWDLYEDVGDVVCRSNLSGVIETDDGAKIRFDTMGFFKVPDKSKSHLWVTTAGVQFETDDERYAWLNDVLGIWEGTFNMETYRHHYQVYANNNVKEIK
jgi:hypothetical protein